MSDDDFIITDEWRERVLKNYVRWIRLKKKKIKPGAVIAKRPERSGGPEGLTSDRPPTNPL